MAATNVRRKLAISACLDWSTTSERSYVKVAAVWFIFSFFLCFFLILVFVQINSTIDSILFWQFLHSDINECQLDPDSCDDGYKCINTVGSFDCILLSKKPKYEKPFLLMIILPAIHAQMPSSVNTKNLQPNKQNPSKLWRCNVNRLSWLFCLAWISVDYVCLTAFKDNVKLSALNRSYFIFSADNLRTLKCADGYQLFRDQCVGEYWSRH